MVPSAPKLYETYQNVSLGPNGVDRVRSLRKIPMRLIGTNFCTSSASSAPSFVRQPYSLKCAQIVRNAPNVSLGSDGVDRVHSLRKIPMQLRAMNFCTSSASFAPTFVRKPNGLECTQMVRNAPKHQFRVQWVGSGVFVAKNSEATTWHELLQ